MIIEELLADRKDEFNALADHPLQSWEWGEFKEQTGLKTVRLGGFENKKLKTAYQINLKDLPPRQLSWKVAYFPKGPMPDQEMLAALRDLGEKEKLIFVRMEPNVGTTVGSQGKNFEEIRKFLLAKGCRLGRPIFTRYTFRLDLTQSEEKLLAKMKEKTRYNLRLAQKHGVAVEEDNSNEAFETYLQLLMETTQRQGFYAHASQYHRKMWAAMKDAGFARLLLAKYQGKVLAAWILFIFKKTLYYPYGASSREHREVMPAYALMWAAIQFGQQNHCEIFDLWGSLGPNPDFKDPWFGFHRFKEGFGPDLIEFIGTYDLVINSQIYPLIRKLEDWRWQWLRFRARLPF